MNATNQIQSLSKKSQAQKFSYLGITFFPNITLMKLSDILQTDFEYFILDMGVLNTYTVSEFNRCHKQFMVGNLCKWKSEKTKKSLEQLMKNTTIHPEYITFLGNPFIKESLNSNLFSSFLRVLPFPYVKNPFQITSEEFSICEVLIEGTHILQSS